MSSRRRTFRTTEAGLLTLMAICLSAMFTAAAASVSNDCDQLLNAQVDRAPELNGITYCLAEIECRQWHRNRALRPYNFALQQ